MLTNVLLLGPMTLSGCGLLPPLLFDSVRVTTLTWDRLDADLAYLVDDGRDPGGVSALAVELRIDDAPVYSTPTDDADGEQLAVDGDVLLAPFVLDLAEIGASGWERLVGRDDVVPFEVTTAYHYSAPFAQLDYVSVSSGEAPAPRAPELAPDSLDAGRSALLLAVTNPNATEITLSLRSYLVDVGDARAADVDPATIAVVVGPSATEVLDVPLPDWSAQGPPGAALTAALTAEGIVDTVFGPIPYPIESSWPAVTVVSR